MVENDAYQWKPESTMVLIACDGDGIVPVDNTNIAYDYMVNTAESTTVSKQILSADSHGDCFAPSATAVLNHIASMLGLISLSMQTATVSE